MDVWKSSLSSQFEEDIQLPSDENWTSIEQRLFPNKKRRFIVLWIVSLSTLLIGVVILFFQKPSEHVHKISMEKQENKESIKQNKSEKNPSKKDHQKCNLNSDLSKKNEQSKKLSPKSTRNKQNNESIPSNVGWSKVDNTQKTLLNQNKKQTPSIEQLQSNSDIINRKTLQADIDVINTSFENEVVENSNQTSINFDSIIHLNLLPLRLLSTATFPPIKELAKKNKADFKPYFSVQVAPLFGRNIRIVSGTFNSGNNNSNAIGDRRVSLPKYGFQTGINYYIQKRLSFNVGFQLVGGDVQSRWFFKYLQVDPSTNDVRIKTSSGEASTSDPTLIQSITNGTTGIYKLRLNHSFSLYSIPVGITYRFTSEKFSPYFRTGVNMEFFGKRTLSLDIMENNVTRNVELNLKQLNNVLTLQGILSLGIESRLRGNWNFFSEAGYYLPMNQFINTNGYSVKMAGSSILIGIKYDFKNNISPTNLFQ